MQYWVLDEIFESSDAHNFLLDAVAFGAINRNDLNVIRAIGHNSWYADNWRQEFRRRAHKRDISISLDSQTFANAIPATDLSITS